MTYRRTTAATWWQISDTIAQTDDGVSAALVVTIADTERAHERFIQLQVDLRVAHGQLGLG